MINDKIRMKIKKSRHAEEDFQMAPMIDMVFLLLVFFMCVSTLSQSSRTIDITLPDSSSARISEDLANRIVINVDAAGSIFLGNRLIPLDKLKSEITTLQAHATATLKWQIRADRKTPFSTIKRIMNTCAEAGAYDLIYATFQSE